MTIWLKVLLYKLIETYIGICICLPIYAIGKMIDVLQELMFFLYWYDFSDILLTMGNNTSSWAEEIYYSSSEELQNWLGLTDPDISSLKIG